LPFFVDSQVPVKHTLQPQRTPIDKIVLSQAATKDARTHRVLPVDAQSYVYLGHKLKFLTFPAVG